MRPSALVRISCLLTLLPLAIPLSAGERFIEPDNPLLGLASQYETSVESFEKVVKRIRGIDRADESLVDRLDDAAARLTSAAKNPRQLNRVYYRLRDVLKLHGEVQQRVFGKYTLHHDLMHCWQITDYHLALFLNEYVHEVENPSHARNVQRIRSSDARRQAYLQFDLPPNQQPGTLIPGAPLLPTYSLPPGAGMPWIPLNQSQ